jgi:hypothetical protein
MSMAFVFTAHCCLRSAYCLVPDVRQVCFGNGDSFDGQLKNDRLHYGLYTFADQGRGRYQGHFDARSRTDDKDGIQYLGDGCVYRGQFIHGYISGLGVVRSAHAHTQDSQDVHFY